MRKFLLLSFTVISVITAAAQDFSNKGKDFWITSGWHYGMGTGNPPVMTLSLTSDVNTTYSIEAYGVGVIASGNITANLVTIVNIPSIYFTYVPGAGTGDGLFIGKAIHVTAVKPIVIYSFTTQSLSSAATLCLPTNVLGKQYYAASYTQRSANSTGNNFITIIAVEDNTSVEIIPTQSTAGGWTPNSVNIVNLNKGEIYQVLGAMTGNIGSDLTGTSIRSIASGSGGCKKIAVFSGSGRLWLGAGCNNGADNLYQQLYPATTWGRKYLTVPSSGRLTNYYRIIRPAGATSATVSLNGAVIPSTSFINNFYEFNNTIPNLIEADTSICVAQYFTSAGCIAGNGNPYDPDMVILNPVEQNISDVTLISSDRLNHTPTTPQHYIHVIMRNGGTGISTFRFDGGTIPPGSFWVTHPRDPNYSYLYLNNVSETYHSLKSDSGFNAIAYGYANFETYAYSAGTNVIDFYQQIGVSTQYGIETTPSVCTNSPFRFKVSLPYCADSIRWDLSNLPGPPVPPIDTVRYTTCNPGAGGPDSTTVVNGVTLYWYSLPSLFSFSTAGVYPVTITTYAPNSSGCGSEQLIDFDLTVSDPPFGDFTWTPGGCVATPYQFIESTPQLPKPTYRWYWNFGDPGSGAANTSTLRNPTHLFSAPGTYTVKYAAYTTPGCVVDTITKTTIVVPDLPNATIAGNTTVCINAPQPFVTFTGTLGTPEYTFNYNINGGATLTSPASVGGVVSIPAPTNVAGTFVYNLVSVRNVGAAACTRNITGQSVTVNITPDATVTLTSAAGTNNQTVCINNPLINITYAVGGSGTGGSVTGLPAGVTGVFAAGVITISGTPTVSGSFPYTVNTTGPCVTPTTVGTINVTADATINLTSAAGSDNQTLCINTALPINITYAVGGSGTGGSVAGLPAGVTGVFAAGVITISGTPSVSGVFNYTVLTTGPCVIPTATGTITVTADGTITRTSAVGTDNQSLCINVPIVNITYAVGGSGNGGSVSGLPAGVTGVFAGGVITISGAATVTGTFNYTVSTTGPCVTPQATGIITINPDAAINLTSAAPTTSQNLCRNSTIAPITYAVTGGGTGATVTGLPAGVTGVYAGGTFTITGTPTIAGLFNYTVNTTGTCVQANATGYINVYQLPTAAFTNTNPACETRVIDFTDASVANTGAVTSWVWNFGDGSPTSTVQNPSHVYPTTGVYNVTLTVTTDSGCVSNPIATIPVTINDRPAAGFIIPEVCLSDTYAQFTDTSSITTGTITGWQWNFGDPASGPNNTSTLQNPQHSYSAVGAYNVELIVTSNNGCTDTIVQSLFVNGSFPVANFTVNNPATLCANDSVSIVEASTVFPGVITKVEIYWDNVGFPGTFDLDDNPITGKVYKHLYPNFQSPLTRTFTIRYRAYSGGVCVNDRIANITVNAAPLVQFNAMPDACLLATPFQITQASEVGGVPGTGTFTGPGVSPTGLFSPLVAGIGTHTIMYTFISATGGCVDTMSNIITVLDTATAKFSYVSPICEGNAASFTEESTAPASVTLSNTSWDFGDGTPIENHLPGTTFTHTFPASGTFMVSMYNVSAYGCSSTPHVLPVTVSPRPVPAFAVDKPDYCLPNAIVKFNNLSAIADGSPLIYSWEFGDPASGNNTSSALSPTHWFSGVGPYSVKLQVTSNVGCIHDTTIIVNNIHPQPKADFSFSKPAICIGDDITITDNSDGKDGIINQWNWDLGDGTTRTTSTVNYTYTDTITYNVVLYTVNSIGCNSDTLTKQFTVYPYPHVNAGPDRFILEGGTITLEPVTFANDAQYLWTPNLYLIDNKIAKVKVHQPLTDMTYTLTVTGRGGCPLSDDVFIKLLKFPVIPNTFTPNNDGINDTWRIDYLNTYPDNRVQIFTRAGQLIFESRGYNTPWDGTLKGKSMPIDTYYYIIEPGNGRDPITGYVTILK